MNLTTGVDWRTRFAQFRAYVKEAGWKRPMLVHGNSFDLVGMRVFKFPPPANEP